MLVAANLIKIVFMFNIFPTALIIGFISFINDEPLEQSTTMLLPCDRVYAIRVTFHEVIVLLKIISQPRFNILSCNNHYKY